MLDENIKEADSKINPNPNDEHLKINTEVEKDSIQQNKSYATGKRKNSIARVWLKKGNGKISINGKSLEKYFSSPVLQMIVNQPLELIESTVF